MGAIAAVACAATFPGLARELRAVYRAVDEKAACEALDAFEDSEWGRKYPPIA